ncbi:MAG: ATP-binding protein [Pseudomonadota bacterium]
MTIRQSDDQDQSDYFRTLFHDSIESLREGFAYYDKNRKLVVCNKQYADSNKCIKHILKPGALWETLVQEKMRLGIYQNASNIEKSWLIQDFANIGKTSEIYEVKENDDRIYQIAINPSNIGGFIITRLDITDQKRMEAAEREGDLLARTVMDASSAVIVMAAVNDGRVIYSSPAAQECYGPKEKDWEYYANPEDRKVLMERVFSDGQVNDFRLNTLNANSEVVVTSVSCRIVEYKGEKVVVTNVVDLTEQIEAEAMLRQVLEACPAPIQMTRATDGKLMYTSFVETDPNGPKKIENSYFAEKDGRKKFITELRKNGWINDYKVHLFDEEGNSFWGELSANLIEFRGEEVIVSSTRDLTEELAIQDELAKQREMLYQTEKMSALGELLAGVAHELNNPLSVVVGHALMMQEEITDPELIKRVKKIGNAAERCAKIVKTFLAMARQRPAKIEQIDANSIIETAVDVIGYSSKSEGIEIISQLAPDLPVVAADADQLTQVIINLIINAEQAIRNSGCGDRISVSTIYNAQTGRIEIAVEDNGPGIPENIRGRVFEPFFTTKEVGQGTGIGLAFCHRIIHSHEGTIRVDQSHNPGTRFLISIPTSMEQEHENTSNKPIVTGSTRALVVNDANEVGELISEILERENIEVDYVTSIEDAYGKLEQQNYDVFLSDVRKLELDKDGNLGKLEYNFSEMLNKSAFITGHFVDESMQQVIKRLGIPILEKPIDISGFRALLKQLLESRKEYENGN